MTDPQVSSLLPRRVDWDGAELRLTLPERGEVEVWLDGTHYARLRADDTGDARLALPVLPNGQSRVNLQLRVASECSAAVTLQRDRAGLARSRAISPPHSLREQDYVDVAALAELQREIAIIVPVYNAPQAVVACLDSVLTQTRGAARSS